MNRSATVVLGALFLALVVACAPATPLSVGTPAGTLPAVPKSGGVLTRAITSEPAQIDPQGAPNSGLNVVIPYLFDTLVVRDTGNKLLPLLAESWDAAPDGKAITMKLKSGVTFADGTSLDAEAVRFTFQRFKETGAKSPIYGGIQQIDGITVVDPLTVRFTFKQPAANFWGTLSMPYAGIISPKSAKSVAETGKGNLVGTGPFTLGEWKAGQSITFKRNPAYNWGAAVTQNRAAPFLDSIVFKVIPDATTQLAALQAGEVDAIFINQPDHRAKLEKDPAVRLEEAVLNSLIYLGFNCRKTPFTDVRVRQALSYAVNKQDIVDIALGGIGKVASAPLPPTLPGYDPSLKSFELGYDPAKAQALLKEAGFAQGADGMWAREGQSLKGTLVTSNRAPNDSIAALLQSQFKAIGVSVEIQQLDSKAVMDATTAGKFDLLLWRYDWNDADALNIYLGSDRIGTTNRVAYSNVQVDELMAKGARELDDAKRQQLYVKAQQIILQEAPWQPLYIPLDVLAINQRVDGVHIGYMGRMLVNDARLVGK